MLPLSKCNFKLLQSKQQKVWKLSIGSSILWLLETLLVAVILPNTKLNPQSKASFYAIAAPENFNPELTLPPPPPPEPEPIIEPEIKNTPQTKKPAPLFTLERITPNFKLDRDNFEQQNIIGETTVEFKLRNNDLVRIDTGFNSFTQESIIEVTNIPLYFSWFRDNQTYKLTLDGGIDLFNRLPVTPYLATQIEVPIYSKINAEGKLQSLLVFSGAIEHQAYKFNAKTLEHKINFWRFRPSFYWQITPSISLFTLGQLGFFNDGNQEFQSFSRLEKKLGEFAIAINVFTWSFQQDLGDTNGYFAPPNFLVYNAELSWKKPIFSWLSCQISGAIGKQRLKEATDNAYNYRAFCTTKVTDFLEADLGYTLSNVRDRNTQETSYLNHSFSSQLRVNF